MKCRVEGCGCDARYKSAQLCQKHYFRVRRGGSTEKRQTRKLRQESPSGYQWLYQPRHPLAATTGYVLEHRAVLYAEIGDAPFSCELCSKPLCWKTCHVDHIDNDVRNNERANLRPTCPTCNTRRGMRAPVEWDRTHVVEFAGERKTPTEWARDPRVKIAGRTIVDRKRRGMSDEEALFGPKKTHNGGVRQKPPRPPAHTRKNAIVITIDGVTQTAAEWSRHPDCTVSDGAIRMRLRLGWDHKSAVFGDDGRKEIKARYARMAKELSK